MSDRQKLLKEFEEERSLPVRCRHCIWIKNEDRDSRYCGILGLKIDDPDRQACSGWKEKKR